MVDTRAQRTTDKILQAAHREFSEQGLAGARIERIAASADVNRQRLYAYFTDKDNLFAVVLSRAFANLAAAVPIPTSRQGLREYAGLVYDYHRKDPSLVRLLAWEGLELGAKPTETPFSRAAYYQASMRTLASTLGVEVDLVARVVLTIVGLSSWPYVVPQQRRLFLAGTDPELPEHLDALREAVLAGGRAVVDNLLPPTPADGTNGSREKETN